MGAMGTLNQLPRSHPQNYLTQLHYDARRRIHFKSVITWGGSCHSLSLRHWEAVLQE